MGYYSPPHVFSKVEFAEVLDHWLQHPQTPHEMTKAYYLSHYPNSEDWPQARWKAARLYAAGSWVDKNKRALELGGWCVVGSGGITATESLLTALWRRFATASDSALQAESPILESVLSLA